VKAEALVYRVVAIVAALLGTAGVFAHSIGLNKALFGSYWGVAALAASMAKGRRAAKGFEEAQ
jgi:uncharacterized membrane protein YtjA (UPF0391 family)